jgi:hypothetical protein
VETDEPGEVADFETHRVAGKRAEEMGASLVRAEVDRVLEKRANAKAAHDGGGGKPPG